MDIQSSMVQEIIIQKRRPEQTRTDIIVDYLGKQYVIELKIWRGDEYNKEAKNNWLNI